MADYEFRYQLPRAPEARLDGSKGVAHDIQAVYRLEGTQDDWQAVPAHYKTVLLDGDALILALDSGTNSAKVEAYKNLISAALGISALVSPSETWNLAGLENFMDANDVAIAAQAAADTFITDDLGLEYPQNFTL